MGYDTRAVKDNYFRINCADTDMESIKAIGAALGIRARSGPEVGRTLFRMIARGQVAVVRFPKKEHVDETLRCLRYIRQTFVSLHNPFAEPLRRIIAGVNAAKKASLSQPLDIKLYRTDKSMSIAEYVERLPLDDE